MNISCGEFRSSNNEYTVKYYVYAPDGNPRAIVQIVHGMCEYFERYDPIARYLCSKGYIVCGHDHIGHGHSVPSDDDLGFFAEKDGDKYVVADVGKMRDIMREKYRALPYILIGHSFGSFVSRAFVATRPDAVDALILSGTAGQKQPVGAGMALCKIISAFRGKRYRSKFVSSIAFAGYNKRFEGNTGVEWVTSDPEMLAKYASDKYCTYTFTLQAYYDMFTLIKFIQSKEWYESMPKNLPIFVIAGENDPVSAYCKGITVLVEKLKEAGVSDLEYKIYSGERHELFTGLRREEAFEDVAEWIEEKVGSINAARVQNV